MAAGITDLVVGYIDDALDADDLQDIGDYIESLISNENPGEWEFRQKLKALHSDISESYHSEKNKVKKLKLKAALTEMESFFADLLITRETESFEDRHGTTRG